MRCDRIENPAFVCLAADLGKAEGNIKRKSETSCGGENLVFFQN